jgi:hypothetical protein
MAKTLYFPPHPLHGGKTGDTDTKDCVKFGQQVIIVFRDSGSFSHDDQKAFKPDFPDGKHPKEKKGPFIADKQKHTIVAKFVDSHGSNHTKVITIAASCT